MENEVSAAGLSSLEMPIPRAQLLDGVQYQQVNRQGDSVNVFEESEKSRMHRLYDPDAHNLVLFNDDGEVFGRLFKNL